MTINPFDFHAHGGDVSRIGEIAEYIVSEKIAGVCLLSLPLAGYPGIGDSSGPHTQPNLNLEVLKSKRLLAKKVGVPVYAFGCLDNRDLISGLSHSSTYRENAIHPEPILAPADQVAELFRVGFDGLKLWEGKPQLASALKLMPHHPRLVDACREAGRLGMPIIFHVADPPEFWGQITQLKKDGGTTVRKNLFEFPEIQIAGLNIPEFDELIGSAALLCQKVPGASLVFPHMLFLAGDLTRASSFLEEAPNAYLDLAPGNYAFAPLSDSPSTAREFITHYASRILFGTDALFFARNAAPLQGDTLKGNRRRCSRLIQFLTTDEIFDNPYPYAPEHQKQIRGLHIPEAVLKPIFNDNAGKLLPRMPLEVRL